MKQLAKPPSVSVVLPVHNAESTVRRAVQSILGQTLTDLELIAVDDGSTDNTSSQLADCHDPRLRVIRTTHQGVAAAANTGTLVARAPLVARMDADDEAHPDRLAEQSRFLAAHAVDVVGTQIRLEAPHGQRTIGMIRYERWINVETLTSDDISALRFVEFPLVNPTLLAHRRYFEIGFADNGFPEDYDLMLRAARRGMRFGKVPRILLNWHDSSERLTRNHPRYTASAFMACRRHHLMAGPLDGVAEVDLWGAGPTGKTWLRWLQAHLTVRRLYDVSPRKIGRMIHDVAVRAPEELAVPDGTPLIIAVGAAGARTKIRSFISDRGYRPGDGAWFVA